MLTDYKIVLELSKAKLLFLENNPDAVNIFKYYIGQTTDYEYYCEYIRVMSLVINSDFDEWYEEIEKYTIKSINIVLVNLIKKSCNEFEFKSYEHDYEKVIMALIDNVELTKSEKERDKLSLLLWNVIMFKLSCVNILKNSLYSNIFLPPFQNTNKLTQRAICYYLFIEQNESRLLLILSYDTIHFHFELVDFSKKTENKIQKIIDFGQKHNGVNHLLDAENKDIINLLYSSILKNYVNHKVLKHMSKKNVLKLSKILGMEEDEFIINGKYEEECINIYGENFFQQLPIEYLNLKENVPIGVEHNISYVLHKEPHFMYRVNSCKSVAIFSEIISQKLLPKTKEEEESICSILKEKHHTKILTFKKDTATKNNLFNTLKNSNVGILHLATHGFASQYEGKETYSLLLTSDRTYNSDKLTYNDILNLDLHSIDLVVLSACNSATGEKGRGFSMQGLANAFIFSGAKSVLATKNYVDDNLTAIFIAKFYEYLVDYPIIDVLRLTRGYFYDFNHSDSDFFLQDKDGNEIVGAEKKQYINNYLSNWAMWY